MPAITFCVPDAPTTDREFAEGHLMQAREGLARLMTAARTEERPDVPSCAAALRDRLDAAMVHMVRARAHLDRRASDPAGAPAPQVSGRPA